MHVCIYMYVCMYVCSYACMYIYVYVCMYLIQKCLWCKEGVARIIPVLECINRLATRSDIKIQPRLSILNTLILQWTHYS